MVVTTNPKVLVLGASGYIGKSTLSSLVSRHSSTVRIYAGVRDPSKLGVMNGVTVLTADMKNKDALVAVLKREAIDRVFVIVPGDADRTKLAINALEAAKSAVCVKFVLMLSVLTAGTNTVFGKQFGPIEEWTRKSGLDFTIIRLPLFIDNNYAHVASIKAQNTFYDPRDPSKMHTTVTVADAGKAAADILAKPTKHKHQLYKLVSPPFSLNDLALAFSKALGRDIKPTTVDFNACKEAFITMGFPEWQANGIIELFKYINKDSSITNESDLGDILKITGEKPMTVQDWVIQNAPAFK